ncbi:hypothetical protein [Kineosporia sp. R_H_3]|uniref:hypothetical protein n=1 Tax=Kineosporia sp. R_H_3 TaxID=1961848 RepID=UPI00117B8214|nr:hypothetical protein [Kineosporia sp. R_H_3]
MTAPERDSDAAPPAQPTPVPRPVEVLPGEYTSYVRRIRPVPTRWWQWIGTWRPWVAVVERRAEGDRADPWRARFWTREAADVWRRAQELAIQEGSSWREKR